MPNFLQLNQFHSRIGFTLIELMVSIAILAIISSVGFVTYSNSQMYARDGKRKLDINAIASALELYKQTNGRYPITDSTNSWWQKSNSGSSGFWLVDKGNTSASPSVPVINFDTQYIDVLPVDPKNSGSYNYAYFSAQPGWSTTAGCLPGGTFYILYVNLENPNDPDRFGEHPYSICGYTTAQLAWLNSSYAVFGGAGL